MDRPGFLSEVFNALTPSTSTPKRGPQQKGGLTAFLSYQTQLEKTLKVAPTTPEIVPPPDPTVVPTRTTDYFAKIAAVLGVFFH